MLDQIVIEDLELRCHIGVTDEERSAPQRLTVTITLTPLRDFSALRDDIRNALDYFKVTEHVAKMAAARPRRLIETLGIEMADDLVTHYPLQSVELHLRKYVLPNTSAVGIRLRRERSAQSPRRVG
ncbi:MAG TPA: dihydroneopterin aldolase [Chthoniobacteraceae bacterium]|jgi:FolB domain-containing protein|nr:dihydroneopterin aldolase [Chthoniobacteraceae bacterium]